MKSITGLLMALFLLAVMFENIAQADDLKFSFTVDQNIKSEDIKNIKSGSEIPLNSWLNSPPTRVELLCYVFDQHCKSTFSSYKDIYDGEIRRYFDPVDMPYGLNVPRQEVGVSFLKEKGVFVLVGSFKNLGKPKKPMKDFCNTMLKSLEMHFGGGGFSYQNTILGPFIQTNGMDPEVVKIAEMVRNNLLLAVSLESTFGNKKGHLISDHYYLQCYKTIQEDKIHYSKSTFRYDPKP